MSEHTPIPSQQWGMQPDQGVWCKRCGYLLVRRDGSATKRATMPCNPARIALR
jgi:hypothetical protein